MSAATGTLLATDIVGSRRLLAHHPHAFEAAHAQHDALLRAAVEIQGGRVCAHLGDGVLADFRHPIEAVAAAVDGQRALAAADWGTLPGLAVRMAVYTGEIVSLVDRGRDPLARQCLRLLAIGHGGQILLSATTAEVVRTQRPDGASVQALGWHRLRDFQPREQVFQVLHPALPADFRPLNSGWPDRWRRYAGTYLTPGARVGGTET